MITTLFYIIYIIILIYILKNQPTVLFIYFLFFVNHFFIYTSVFYLDFGNIEMKELGSVSVKTEYSIIVFFLEISAIFLMYFYFKRKKKFLIQYIEYIKYKKIKYLLYWIILFYLIIFILIINILISGSPLWVAGINKTTFWNIAKFGFLKPISSQILIVALFSGMFYVYVMYHNMKKYIKILLHGIWILLVIYLVLMGHRFGQLLKIIYIFFLPILLYQSLLGKLRVMKFVNRFLLIISLIFFITLNYFESKYGKYAIDMLQQRIFAMEGQLTYITFYTYFNGDIQQKVSQFWIELENIFGFIKTSYIGMQFLMDKYMPLDMFKYYLEYKINLAEGYYSLLFYYVNMSFIGLFFVNLLIIYLLIKISYMFVKSILKYDFLIAALSSKLFFLIYSLVGTGSLDKILNIKFLFYLSLIIFILYIRDVKKYKRIKSESIAYN